MAAASFAALATSSVCPARVTNFVKSMFYLNILRVAYFQAIFFQEHVIQGEF